MIVLAWEKTLFPAMCLHTLSTWVGRDDEFPQIIWPGHACWGCGVSTQDRMIRGGGSHADEGMPNVAREGLTNSLNINPGLHPVLSARIGYSCAFYSPHYLIAPRPLGGR